VTSAPEREIRICLIIHNFIPGGMERVMAELAWHLSTKPGVDLHLLVYGYQRQFFYSLPDSIVLHEPDFTFNNSNRFWSTIRTSFFIRRTIQRVNPDTALSFGAYWNSFVLLSLLGLKIIIYISDRSRPDKNLGKWQEFLRKCFYPKASGFIAQTTRAAEIAKARKLNRNIRIIGNPIRKIQMDQTIERENIVLNVGRLIRTKNLDRIIRMFASIRMPGWKMVLVGGDAQGQNLMRELKQLVETLSAQDIIFFEGYQKDIESYYRRSKIFVFTSSSEGFPNVIGEALSAGLPVISYDCVAGPSEMINHRINGFLIPLFSDKVFSQRLKMLMENEKVLNQMSDNASQSTTKFLPDVMCERYFSFITENIQ